MSNVKVGDVVRNNYVSDDNYLRFGVVCSAGKRGYFALHADNGVIHVLKEDYYSFGSKDGLGSEVVGHIDIAGILEGLLEPFFESEKGGEE